LFDFRRASLRYRPLDSKVNIPELEDEVLKFWEETNAYWKRVELQEQRDRPHWSFIDGPILVCSLPIYAGL
jgi:isoleucyl-tRNA synthetase